MMLCKSHLMMIFNEAGMCWVYYVQWEGEKWVCVDQWEGLSLQVIEASEIYSHHGTPLIDLIYFY